MSPSKRVELIETRNGHIYVVDGRKLPSATTILKVINKQPLVNWMVREERAGVLSAAEAAYKELPRDVGDIMEWDFRVMVERKLPRGPYCFAASDKAAKFGTLTHSLVEQWAKGLAATKFQPAPEVRHGYEAFLRWAERFRFEPVLVEYRVYSLTHEVAGTLDITGYLTRSDGRRQYALVDVKTSGAIWPDYFLQTALYRECLRDMGEREPEVSVIVRTPKDASEPECEWKVCPPQEQVLPVALAAVTLWRWQRDAEEAFRDQRKK